MEETDNYWENRRTIRRYADRDVPSELLDGLLLKASHAPTTGNMQLYSVSHVTKMPGRSWHRCISTSLR